MSDDPLAAMICAGTALLGISVDPDWHDAIYAHLDVCLRMGTEVAAFPLPDEAEPAPVFIP